MLIEKMACAALSALLFLTASAGYAETETLIPEEVPACAAAAEIGLRKLAASGEKEPAEAEGNAAGEAESLPGMSWVEEKGLALGESSVVYPAFREGTLEEAKREAVNEQILTDGRIREYVTRLSQLLSGGKLEVNWRGTVLGPVFSFEIRAEGAVSSPRHSFVWTAGNIDLRDGHEVTMAELFPDGEAAAEIMEAYLEGNVAPEMSAHLQNSSLTPIPELFRLSERGLILLYPEEQLSTLSDRAGSVLIPWDVLGEVLNPAEDGIPEAAGIRKWLEAENLTAEELETCGAGIREWTDRGEIPGIPARLGDSLAEKTEAWKMLTDPDLYALGRMFALEGAEFRNVFLLTDALGEGWENSRVDGIQMTEGSFFGLTVGRTTRETWRKMLGEPEHTLSMDAEQADAWRTVPGSRDYYEFGRHRLQLHADAEGVLACVIVAE